MSKFDQLLSTPMTRKQFLITLGTGFISLFGFSAIMGLFTENNTRNEPLGYGQQNYGP